MNHVKGAECLCVAEHRPHPLDGEAHHIWPKGMGGPDVPLNRVYLCPTAHTNVHEILRVMLKAQSPASFRWFSDTFVEPVNRYAYRIALLGYRRFVAGAMVTE